MGEQISAADKNLPACAVGALGVLMALAKHAGQPLPPGTTRKCMSTMARVDCPYFARVAPRKPDSLPTAPSIERIDANGEVVLSCQQMPSTLEQSLDAVDRLFRDTKW